MPPIVSIDTTGHSCSDCAAGHGVRQQHLIDFLAGWTAGWIVQHAPGNQVSHMLWAFLRNPVRQQKCSQLLCGYEIDLAK